MNEKIFYSQLSTWLPFLGIFNIFRSLPTIHAWRNFIFFIRLLSQHTLHEFFLFSLGFPNYPSTAETLEKRKTKIDIFQKMPLCCKGGRGNDFLFARSFLYFIVTLCAVFVKITSWNQALIAVSLIRGENENKNWHFCDRMNGHAQRTLSLYTDSSSQTHKIFN